MVVFKENWYCLYMLFWANGAWLWNSVIILHESMQMGNWKIWSSSLMEFYLINEKENVLKTEDSDSRVKSLSQKLFTTKALLILSFFVKERDVWHSLKVYKDPMDGSLPGSSVHGILQARILEWVAIPFFREYSWARDWTPVSCIAGRFFIVWTTIKAPKVYKWKLQFGRVSVPLLKTLSISILVLWNLTWNVLSSFNNFFPTSQTHILKRD